MGQSFKVLLDFGGLYLALGAVLCTIIGGGRDTHLACNSYGILWPGRM